MDEDETGHVWTFLSEALNASLVETGAIVVAGDPDAPVVAEVIDIVDKPAGKVVHLRILPGAVDAHPDAVSFRSLARCATIRAATLLAEIGDCRARFPDAESLSCLAGVAPSTRASGRHRAVTFRFSSDKKLRDALCDFAGDSWRGNAWAEARYRQLRADGKSHPHAERILARSWAHIIWRCWQDRTPYDPSRHGGHRHLLEAAA